MAPCRINLRYLIAFYTQGNLIEYSRVNNRMQLPLQYFEDIISTYCNLGFVGLTPRPGSTKQRICRIMASDGGCTGSIRAAC